MPNLHKVCKRYLVTLAQFSELPRTLYRDGLGIPIQAKFARSTRLLWPDYLNFPKPSMVVAICYPIRAKFASATRSLWHDSLNFLKLTKELAIRMPNSDQVNDYLNFTKPFTEVFCWMPSPTQVLSKLPLRQRSKGAFAEQQQ